MRQAYVVHILDAVLQERSIVVKNDRQLEAEEKELDLAENGRQITLDNVFQLAKEQEEKDGSDHGSDNDDEEEGEGDEDKEEGTGKQFGLMKDMELSKAHLSADGDHATQDQALVRPKVLILTPFKSFAYQIVEQIVLLANGGRWKGVSKKKKFKDEFGLEEEAFNDFFRIGIAFNGTRNTSNANL